MLGGQEPSRSPKLRAVGSWDVFDKVTELLSLDNFKTRVLLCYCLSHLTMYCLQTMGYHHKHGFLYQYLLLGSQSIINVQNQLVEMDQDKSKTFLQKYEQELRHFGK